MIIDSHQHVFWHFRDDAGLVANMDECGIDVAWLLSWEIPPSEDAPNYHRFLNPLHIRQDGTHAGIPLSDLLIARERYPDRFIVGYCPHPLMGDAPARFESAYRMHDVRVCGEWKFRIPFDDPRSLELFRKAGELNCPVVLHLDVPYFIDTQGNRNYCPTWYGGTVANLERALQACPQTIFIGHAPGFWREISGDAGHAVGTRPEGPVTPGGRLYHLFDNYPNLYADLSAYSGMTALSRDPGHAQAFITRYADRLLYARDYYDNNLQTFLSTLDLDQQVCDKIFMKNACKLVPASLKHSGEHLSAIVSQ